MARVSRSEKRIAEIAGRIEGKKQRLTAIQNFTRPAHMKVAQEQLAERKKANAQVMQKHSESFQDAFERVLSGGENTYNNVDGNAMINALFDPEMVRLTKWANGIGIPETQEEQILKGEIRMLERMLEDTLPIDEQAGIFDKELDAYSGDTN
jgi:hypothetical protein